MLNSYDFLFSQMSDIKDDQFNLEIPLINDNKKWWYGFKDLKKQKKSSKWQWPISLARELLNIYGKCSCKRNRWTKPLCSDTVQSVAFSLIHAKCQNIYVEKAKQDKKKGSVKRSLTQTHQ